MLLTGAIPVANVTQEIIFVCSQLINGYYTSEHTLLSIVHTFQ